VPPAQRLHSDLLAVRISPAGEVLGPEIIVSASETVALCNADVTFGGGVYMVSFWEMYGTGSICSRRVCAARVSASGEVLDVPRLVLRDACADCPSVVFNSDHFLLAWQEYNPLLGSAPCIKGARITPAGAVLDSTPIDIGMTTTTDQFFPRMASNGVNSLVVWYDDRDFSTTGFDVYGARVSHDGQVLDPGGFPISTDPADEWAPNVVFDGAKYVVVWSDGRSLVDFDLYGARVLTSGQVVDPDGLALNTSPGHQSLPAMALGGSKSLLVWDDDRDFRTNGRDILGQLVDNTAPLPAPVAEAGPDKTIASGGSTTLEGSASGGVGSYSYSWSPTTGLSDANAAQPLASPAATTTYTLTVHDSLSQEATDTVEVIVQPPTATFADVPLDHWAWPFIEAIYREGITTGCDTSPLRYCPDAVVTRGEMAAFICRAAGQDQLTPPTATFADVPTDHQFFGWIERLADPGSWATPLTSGCDVAPLRYCPSSNCLRQQMATFICRACGKTWYDPGTASFPDVPRGADGIFTPPIVANGCDADGTHQFYGWIERLADTASWGAYGAPTRGFEDGTFRPNNKCTRSEMAAFLCRAFNIPY